MQPVLDKEPGVLPGFLSQFSISFELRQGVAVAAD